ncbi:hypothetical protein J4E83_000894 [Alternaria metachromatica]|uniref:uncharacterized protein n=1 Tax=Alternaria metachromatica TaxID=283354 RepID=UPI0020C557B9|nr:uncharacterized protein J4E83_000894 [Alternaria metachromatica]KAI4635940.1 hypothetical protein J4E83_000894 [Alternaria metachromatica]
MHLMNLLLACIFALCVIAAPADFKLHSALTIPVSGSATYDADLAAAIAYARSHPTSSVQTAADGPKKKYCGRYVTTPDSDPIAQELLTDGTNVCINMKPGYTMEIVGNTFCNFCMYFDDDGCFGALVWNKGPDRDQWQRVPRTKSYICFD